jgi:hypothetical protein
MKTPRKHLEKKNAKMSFRNSGLDGQRTESEQVEQGTKMCSLEVVSGQQLQGGPVRFLARVSGQPLYLSGQLAI